MASNPASSTATSSTTIVIPSALAFLVSNFHSLVNIKLDSSNYLLWRIQVENAVDANGFFGYLDESIPVPSSQIRDAEGNLTPNPEFSLWRLIDSQLGSCLTASLSQSTLPYVLGLRTAHQVWDSLSNIYNFLSETHVQELRDELYNLSKTSTIEAYIDHAKDIAQKLVAAGSPVDDDELVFRTLQGLPKVFNGLRTAVRAVRTRGHNVSFEELVTMLKSEDKQLGKETSEQDVVNTVLVAAHGNSSQNQESTGNISSMIPYVSSVPVPLPQNQIGANQSQFVPFSSSPQQHQYFPQNFRSSNNRGRGGRGSYYPKGPCDICGRSNHSTNYCYYRPNNMPFDVSNSQWRGYTNFSQSFPWNPMMPGVPQYTMPLYQGYPTQPFRFPAQNSGGYRFSGGFRSPSGPALPMQHS